MSRKRWTAEEREESRAHLAALLPEGSTIYGIVRRVSRTGMSRDISFLIFREDGPYSLGFHIARVLDMRIVPGSGALRVGGCGMDLCFHVVHNLSYALHGYPDSKGRDDKFRAGYTLRSEVL